MRKNLNISHIQQYLIFQDRILGQGSTGCVYQALNKSTNTKVAIKIINLKSIDNQVSQYLLEMEKAALQATTSKYLLHAEKVITTGERCYIVTELLSGGTLKKNIQVAGGRLEEMQALRLFRQILSGYAELVGQGILHRDLKPANIMLHEGVPVIIDFGYCEISGHAKPKLQYNVGSPSYMAPESFYSNTYNQKTEMWALGMLLYECLTGRTIDNGRHMSKVYEEIKNAGVMFPSFVGAQCRAIISWCLSMNPTKRPTCRQLVQRYFSNGNISGNINSNGNGRMQNQQEPQVERKSQQMWQSGRVKMHSLQTKAYQYGNLHVQKETALQFAHKTKRTRVSKDKQLNRLKTSSTAYSTSRQPKASIFTCRNNKLGLMSDIFKSTVAAHKQTKPRLTGCDPSREYFADYRQYTQGRKCVAAEAKTHCRAGLLSDRYDYLRA